jgi:protein-S-isoprenylcysteine O-methyltransferase Ste14
MHEPPVLGFAEAFFFWAAFIWAFLPEIRHSGILAGAPSNQQDAGTLMLINIASDIALILAFTVSFFPWLVIPYPRIALYVGSGLLAAGSLGRRYCFRTLGKYFTATVTVSADQPVIDYGPYRWIRHPGYTAGFIMYLGIGLAFGSGLSLIIFFLMICFVYSRRIRAEEKALLEVIGEPYRRYMARTKRFIPFII